MYPKMDNIDDEMVDTLKKRLAICGIPDAGHLTSVNYYYNFQRMIFCFLTSTYKKINYMGFRVIDSSR